MKTLNNLNLNNTFDEIVIGQVTICAPSSAVYKLTLPIDTGTPGQVLTTDGNGVTSWATSAGGSVTFVAATVPTFLNISGSPITTSGTLAIGLSGTALPVTSGGTGVLTKTGTGSVVLSNSPTINALTLTGTTLMAGLNLTGILGMQQNEIRLFSDANPDHGLMYDGVTINGPNLHGFDGGILSRGSGAGDVRLTWNAAGVNIPQILSAASLTLTTDLAVVYGGTGVSLSTGATRVVLSDNPAILSPTLTTPIIKGASFDTVLTTQATEDWTLSLPVNDGNNGQVLTTNGGGLTSWSTSTVGSVTSVAATVPPFLNISGSPITTSGTLAIGLSGTALPVNSGGTGVLTKTGTGSVVLSNSPTINTLNLTGDTDVSGDIYLNAVLYLKAATDQFHGIQYSNAGGNDGPDIFGFGRGQLSIQGVKSLSWDANGVDVVGTISAESMTLTTDLAVVYGGTGVGLSTGATRVVLSDNPAILSPTLTTPIIKGTSFDTVLTTQATEDWTLSLPVNDGNNGQVLTTNGGGLTSWSTSTVGSVTSVAATVPPFLNLSGSPITTSGTLAIGLSGTALPVTSGGTGVLLKTGATRVVLSDSPTIDALTLTGTTNVNSIVAMNNNQILLRGSGDAAHGLGYDGVVIDGPNLHGTSGGRLSQGISDGTARLTWSSDGVQIPDILRLVNPLHIIKSGAGEKDVMFIGESLSTNRCAVFKWNGNTNTEQNYFDIGFFGNSNRYRFRGDGKLTIDKLQFNNAVLSRTITLFEDADNDHQYSGFGINAGVLRYQVGGSGNDHIFYSAIDDSSSLELLRVRGTGDIVIPNGVLGMQQNEIRLFSNTNADHGLLWDSGVDGPNLHGTGGGKLSYGSGLGTARMTWDSTGTYTRGTGGANTYIAQYQTDLTGSLDSSIAVTAGESDEAALFFGTVNVNDPTKAHKTAIIADGQNTWGRSNLHFCINDEGNDSASATLTNSRMMIERTGDVGIGNTNPSVKLDVTGDIKASGSITGNSLSLSTVLPTGSGGTGVGGGSTGGDGVVLKTNPTISALVTTGITNLGGTGETTNINGPVGVMNGNLFMNQNTIDLNNNTSGMRYLAPTEDGPEIFAQGRGRLSSGGVPRLYWNSNGLSTNGTDHFGYSEGSWTPVWGGTGTATFNSSVGHYIKMGRQVTVFVEIDIASLAFGANEEAVFFTGFPLTNTLTPWQRCNIASGVVVGNFAPFNFTIKNGSSDMHPYEGTGVTVKTSNTGGFVGFFYSVFSFIS